MEDRENIIAEMQEEIRRHSITINGIITKYKNVFDECLLKGLDVKQEVCTSIVREEAALKEFEILFRLDEMKNVHKKLMDPICRLGHLFILLDNKIETEGAFCDFAKEKDAFIQKCKEWGIVYSLENFPDKKVPTIDKMNIQVYADECLKCEYIVKDGYVIITKCLEYYKPDIIIPQKIGDLDVKEIDTRAFCNCDEIITIKIPTTISRIGNCAFAACKRLRMISGWNIKSKFKVESKAFWKTDIRRIDMPFEQVKFVDKEAFEECKFLLSINIHGFDYEGDLDLSNYFIVSKACSVDIYKD